MELKYTVDENRLLTPGNITRAGVQGDNLATTLVFNLPDDLKQMRKRLIFKSGNGDPFATPYMEANKNNYDIPDYISILSRVTMQMEFVDENNNIIAKTSTVTLSFDEMINIDDGFIPADGNLTSLNFGRYFVTPAVGGASNDFWLEFPTRSFRFGYYALAINGNTVEDTFSPVNRSVKIPPNVFNGSDRVTVVFYDLRDIVTAGNTVVSGLTWDELLSQDWYEVTDDSPVSLELRCRPVAKLDNVQYGTLIK